MVDWNGDGNSDRRDDDFYNNVLDGNQTPPTNSSGGGWSIGKTLLFVGMAILFLILKIK
ncbi:MAG: hypothetical protein SO434_07975 [Eubacteriales bacterium]|nr:hypothetical protein [Eubacteriales bacterium]